MKTITVQIGNSDNKLSQKQWHNFVKEVRTFIESRADEVHFFGGSSNWELWQNVTIIFNIKESENLKSLISQISKNYLQDAVAWTEGVTEFI